MAPYIEPKQRGGYLRFIAVVVVVAWFVPALWGMVLGFLIVLLVVGVPVFVARSMVDKYFELNRTSIEATDDRVDEDEDGPRDDDVPWWVDYRRDGRVRRN